MTLKEIKSIIAEEKKLYIPANYKFQKFTHQKRFLIWKYLAYFRLCQHWQDIIVGGSGGIYAKLAYRYTSRKKNIYGEKAGVEIASQSRLGRRLDIWHGNTVISAHLGDDCIIHGNNVLGNNGSANGEIPVLGDRVDVGVGAVVIGNHYIADNCKIGANAVVTKSFDIKGSIIVGVPAVRKD